MINHIKTNWKYGCCIKLTFNNGSYFEDQKTAGYLHIGEHLSFSGTKTINRNELGKLFGEIFGYIEATTSREAVAFFCDFHKDDFERSLKILHEMIYNWHCTEKRFKEEKRMLRNETKDYFSSYEYRRAKYVYSLLPIKQHQVITSNRFIESFNYRDVSKINKLWKKFLNASDLDITIITGELSLKNINIVEKLFPKAKKINKSNNNFKVLSLGTIKAGRAGGFYFKSNTYDLKTLLLDKMYNERWLNDDSIDIDYNFLIIDGTTAFYGYHDEKSINQIKIKDFFHTPFTFLEFSKAKQNFLKYFELLMDSMDSSTSLHWFDGFRIDKYAELGKIGVEPNKIYNYFQKIDYKDMISFIEGITTMK
jgi:hypothetical protein